MSHTFEGNGFMSDSFVSRITDQEYIDLVIDLVKLWKSEDPVDSNEMVAMNSFAESLRRLPDDKLIQEYNRRVK